MTIKNIKSRKFIKLLIFLPVLIFSLFSFANLFTPAKALVATSHQCSVFDTQNLGKVTGNSYDFSFIADVNCRCAINECRLSTNVSGSLLLNGSPANPQQYTCFASSTDGNIDNLNTYYLGSTTDFEQYSDKNVFNQFGIDTKQKSSLYYVDIFSTDVSRQVIPEGSYCRTSPSDPQGVAYWYYPGYFDIIQGREPQKGTAQAAVGGRCTDVVFVSYDLFGNKIDGTSTFFGCIPNSVNGLVAFIVRLAIGIAIILTFLIVLINLIQIVGNSTNPDAVAEAQKRMSSAIFTLIGILLSVTILSILGIQILYLGTEGVGGSLFRVFVGG